MNKPISKHALRRAMEKASAEGIIQCGAPIGGVVDRIWHDIEKSSYTAPRKRDDERIGPRTLAATEPPELDMP